MLYFDIDAGGRAWGCGVGCLEEGEEEAAGAGEGGKGGEGGAEGGYCSEREGHFGGSR